MTGRRQFIQEEQLGVATYLKASRVTGRDIRRLGINLHLAISQAWTLGWENPVKLLQLLQYLGQHILILYF